MESELDNLITSDSFQADLYNFLYSKVRSHAEPEQLAKDLAQETLLDVLENKNKYVESSKGKARVLTIANNNFLDYYRKKRKRNIVDLDKVGGETRAVSNDFLNYINEENILAQYNDLKKYVDQLSEWQQIVVNETARGLNTTAIAEKYKRTNNSVVGAIRNARRTIANNKQAREELAEAFSNTKYDYVYKKTEGNKNGNGNSLTNINEIQANTGKDKKILRHSLETREIRKTQQFNGDHITVGNISKLIGTNELQEIKNDGRFRAEILKKLQDIDMLSNSHYIGIFELKKIGIVLTWDTTFELMRLLNRLFPEFGDIRSKKSKQEFLKKLYDNL